MVNRVQTGQHLGNYRLLQRLGTGGFAEVYLGEHRYLKHQVAIKVLLVELSGDDKVSQRFLREAQTVASLKHPHIVGCLDFGIEQQIPYIVMDYAPGGTLRDRHPEGDVVPVEMTVTYAEQVADALQYAHNQGVIHLDVKPENMLLGASGEVLLSDFGLARFTRNTSARVTSLIGTIGYMAPEYIQRRPQAASDQYSLAMVVYEWLTGIRPFDSDDERITAGQQLQLLPPSLRDIISTIPVAVDDVVLAALAKKPEERYPNIGDFAEALVIASLPSSEMDSSSLVPEKPETLYKEGLKAKGQGQLELAKQLLEALQTRDPSYRADVVSEQLQQIDITLRPQLIARSRTEAEAANAAGQWDQEINAWNTLLRLDPTRVDAQEARTRIRLAREHQLNDHLYQDAAQLVSENNRDGAQQLLQQLYAQDTYYGDPQGLARKVRKVRIPLTYQQEQAQRRKEDARQDQQDRAVARQEMRRGFVEAAYGWRLGKLWLVGVALFMLVWSAGATVGAVTQSWLWALFALVVAVGVSWGLGYRKALGLFPLIAVFASSAALSLILTLSLAHLDYGHFLVSPYTDTISTGFFSSKDVTLYHHLYLFRQLTFGLVGGVAMTLVGVAVAFFLKPPYGKSKKEKYPAYISRNNYRAYPSPFSSETKTSPYLSIANLIWIAVCVGVSGLFVWVIVGIIALTSEWGFGFDLGVNMAWLGLGIGCGLGVGVGASIPVWWTAVKQWIQKR